jgi:transposase
MAHAQEIVAKVRAAYVYDRQGLDTIADRFEIGIATVRRWKSKAEADGDDWERARSAARMSGDGTQLIAQMILEDYLALHQATVEGVKADAAIKPLAKAEILSRLADAFTKTMAAVGKASPELSRLSIATDVMQRFAKFVTQSHPHLAEPLLEVIEPFAAELARDYG